MQLSVLNNWPFSNLEHTNYKQFLFIPNQIHCGLCRTMWLIMTSELSEKVLCVHLRTSPFEDKHPFSARYLSITGQQQWDAGGFISLHPEWRDVEQRYQSLLLLTSLNFWFQQNLNYFYLAYCTIQTLVVGGGRIQGFYCGYFYPGIWPLSFPFPEVDTK